MSIINTFKTSMIAPCGMNCGICIGHLREKKKCPGCNSTGPGKVPHCSNCSIFNCEYFQNSKSKFCYGCKNFPCRRLKNLDKRYRTKYGMSMIENLNSIKIIGIREFVKNESKKWTCTKCSKTICVHRNVCIKCGAERNAATI